MDEILCIYHDPDDVLNEFNCYLPLKSGFVGNPMIYFGKMLKLMQLYNGIWAWSMNLFKYIHQTVRICEEYVVKS